MITKIDNSNVGLRVSLTTVSCQSKVMLCFRFILQ